MKNKLVICDFDGTITKVDMIGDFLETFACENWHLAEAKWRRGEIGSRECMESQFAEIKNIDEKQIEDFINTREVDEYFAEFYQTAKNNGIKVIIVSDGFDFFIKPVLKRIEIEDMEIFTNHMEFINGRFHMEFPNLSKGCKKHSATCKCAIVKKLKKEYDTVFYIGDGQSDYCVCNKADVLFAKKHLKDYCDKNDIDYVNYTTFRDVTVNDKLGFAHK